MAGARCHPSFTPIYPTADVLVPPPRHRTVGLNHTSYLASYIARACVRTFPGANMAIMVVPVIARSARYMLATLPMTYL